MVDQVTVDGVTSAHPGGDRRRRTSGRARHVALATVSSFLWAGFCCAVVDFWQTGGSTSRIVGYEITGAMRGIFLLSTLVVWLVLLLPLVAITNRFVLSGGLLLAASILVGFANYEKLQTRREPIYPSDFTFLGQAGFLRDMVDPSRLVVIGLLAVMVVLTSLILGRMTARRWPPARRTDGRVWWAWSCTRVGILVVAVGLAGYLHSFNSSHNLARTAYERAGAEWAFWFQDVNYSRHGFVAGFLYNMPVPAMRLPPGYSREAMAEIARRYSTPTDSPAQHPADATLPNVVVVLSEAFSDPTRVRGASLAEDPIPRIRSLMARTTSGQMLAQMFGGGTANMEFETLTGQSLSQFLPQMNTPYQMLLPTLASYPSVVGYLRRQRAGAVAVHPYMTTMYKRYEVYPELGFERFVHDTTMHGARKIDHGAFISDESAYDEVLRQLEIQHRPSLVNLVTMQNHYPMKDQYDDPIGVTGVSGEEADELGHYARGLRHTDDATMSFLAALQKSPEPTAVVFFGDHLPAFWTTRTAAHNDALTMRQTPYFLWSNHRALPVRHEQLTSPIYFLPLLWRELGLPLPPYYRLLLRLHDEIPAMEQGEYHLRDGRTVQEDDLPPAAARLLDDYRLVQYDFSIGQRYAVDAMFPQAR